MKNTTNDLIGVKEASDITGLKASSIYVKVCKGELPHYKQFGRLFFSRSELISLIEAGRRKSKYELNEELDRRFAGAR